FLLHAPAVVPGLSEFAAAPNVRNGVDHAALQKTQAIRIEVHGHGDAIAAVAVKKQRSGAIASSVAAIDKRDGNARAVSCAGVQSLADILRSVVTAKHGLLLAKNALARAHVVVEYGTRCNQGLVLEAHVRNVELGIVAEGGVIGGLCEFDPVRGFQKICATRLQLHDSEIGQPSFAFE